MAPRRSRFYKWRYIQVPWIVLLTFLFILIAIASVINSNLNAELKHLSSLVDEGSYLVAQKQREVAALADQLILASTDEFIATEARTQYGYLAPGEIRFVVTNPEALWGEEGAPVDLPIRR